MQYVLAILLACVLSFLVTYPTVNYLNRKMDEAMFKRKKFVGMYLDEYGTVGVVLRKGDRWACGIGGNVSGAHRVASIHLEESRMDGLIVDVDGTHRVTFDENGAPLWRNLGKRILFGKLGWIPA